MDLKAVVEKYWSAAGSFGKEVRLDRLGLSAQQIETLFSNWEDDYHLSRHFELIPASWLSGDAVQYRINGVLYSAVVFQETIRDVLG